MPTEITDAHFINHHPLTSPLPENMQYAMFGMGCFWGVERIFWQLDGVWLTMVGYAGGNTPDPNYESVCGGQTGHNEVVKLIFNPAVISYAELLRQFWQGHDPTQGMRQGNDRGTQYRSGIYTYDAAQQTAAKASKQRYADQLAKAGLGQITTEITDAPEFHYAEGYHQQYLAKNPSGYCGIGGTGVSCPIGIDPLDADEPTAL